MPLPSDERIVALAQDLIQQFDTIFGVHPGFRPAHAKGTLLTGKFTPAAGAATLTRAPHLNRESTPVTVRFSNSTGIPLMPDNNPNANPRGRPVMRSRTISVSITLPCAANISCSWFSVALKERFPTNNFVFMMTVLTPVSSLFPTIGFQIITEARSTEDFPDSEW